MKENKNDNKNLPARVKPSKPKKMTKLINEQFSTLRDEKKKINEEYWKKVKEEVCLETLDPDEAWTMIWKNIAIKLKAQGKSFVKNETIVNFLQFMRYYAVNDMRMMDYSFSALYGVDRRKGILLIGEPGCGKTLIMSSVMKFMKVPFFRADVLSEMKMDELKKYQVNDLCVDDLGTENRREMSRSTDQRVLGKMLEMRHHNQFIQLRHMRTFVTTNLDLDGLESLYGKRVRSRIQEMFNVFVLDAPDFRNVENS